ncbi:MAG: alpha/beta hydrolase, partial [Saprospiraceae bacterium]|nr:alpha/beta hydrolase [Saprospiraceae bacterium]
ILEEKAKRPLEELDLSDAYPELNIREALIVHDRFDQIVPFSSARAIAAGWPNARLLVSEGYGHFRLMKNPDLIAEVAAFLGD